LRLAHPGDGIVSFADAKVSYIGRIEGYAFEAPKPPEFGDAGESWALTTMGCGEREGARHAQPG